MSCSDTSLPFSQGAVDPASVGDPFTRVRYRYGMLLGAEDFTVEQRAHLLRDRLHHALLHGAGTVWGLRVEATSSTTGGPKNRLVVNPGLAVDAAGRFLYVDGTPCWPDAEALQRDVWETFPLDPDDSAGNTRFAWVVLRYLACESQPVPALRQPCVDASAAETYSRLNERAVVELAAEAPVPPWKQLLTWLGRKEGSEDPGVRFAGDATLPRTNARDALLELVLGPAEGLAALWVGEPDAPLLLARVRLVGSTEGTATKITVADVDNSPRALLPSTEVWLERALGQPLAGGEGKAPFKVTNVELKDDGSHDYLEVTFSHPVNLTSTDDGVRLRELNSNGWINRTLKCTLASPKVLHVKLKAQQPGPGDAFHLSLSGGDDGAPPILDADGRPLAGWFDDPTPPRGRGRTATYTGTWSS